MRRDGFSATPRLIAREPGPSITGSGSGARRMPPPVERSPRCVTPTPGQPKRRRGKHLYASVRPAHRGVGSGPGQYRQRLVRSSVIQDPTKSKNPARQTSWPAHLRSLTRARTGTDPTARRSHIGAAERCRPADRERSAGAKSVPSDREETVASGRTRS
jgi:hypothetical protein